MNFREAESYLLSLGNEVETMKLGLDNIRKLLAALGDPQKNYLKVQVAGTNGKGSVCAFLDSICLQADIRTGVFTSPHLILITERVRIGGVDISEEDFARCATVVRDTAEGLLAIGGLEYTPTFFEQVTAIALLAFAEARVELAILETGLGGRLDATTEANAVIAAITRIDLDHQEYLGHTIQQISEEKAAIIHEGSEVVIGEQQPDAARVITAACLRNGVEPTLAEHVRTTVGSGWLMFDTGRAEYRVESLGLNGAHQVENSKIAILVAEILQRHFPIIARHIIGGLKKARHPGRLQFIGDVLLDGSHNVGGAKALRVFLDEFIDQPITLIFGAMNDKDVRGIAEILFPKANQVIVTQANNSRAMAVEELAEQAASGVDRKKVARANSVDEALKMAREMSADGDLILVTGSLYLVGDVKRLLKSQI